MIQLQRNYAGLSEGFFEKAVPKGVSAPKLVRLNESLAAELGIESAWLKSEAGVAMLAGNLVPEGAEPVAQAYGGHQFGGWVPRLGDGRAVLLGEVVDSGGLLKDIQLKGSGRTPFSRGGDGRATLGSVVREYVMSEAMAALGVPTTRALAVVETGEMVPRQQMHPGGVLMRVASSHIRVGTFQYFLAQQNEEAIRELADFAIQRHCPEVADSEEPYLEFYRGVVMAQARLIAQWMQLGFIHGVMNTDNMAVSGETIDYGPCAFMEAFDPGKVFSSIDIQGRYAWQNQPSIGYWNLERLGDAVVGICGGEEKVRMVLDEYQGEFKRAYFEGFGAKFGLGEVAESEGTFIADSLQFVAEKGGDFTQFFRQLTRVGGGKLERDEFGEWLGGGEAVAAWLGDWDALASKDCGEVMAKVNPVRIPRNHRVEEAIQAAESGDCSVFYRLIDAMERPYEEDAEYADLEVPALPHEEVKETFCGT